jgi:malonate-semialdehyde dehydrogenase (acetylating)/methylmalonate-semialdehyde dehydrogenase
MPRRAGSSTEIFGPCSAHPRRASTRRWADQRCQVGNKPAFYRQQDSSPPFRYEAEAGDIGINVGIAAPMAFFPFSGWKESFFGDLHGQGWDAVEFFTQKKVVIERWPKEWSRAF